MKFLTAEIIYRALQRELPEGVYPDGAPASYYSTADNYAFASGVAKSYELLQKIYNNSFPASADELITNWETTVIGEVLPAGYTLEQRRNRVLEKLRAPRGISIPLIETLVRSVIGTEVVFEIIEWRCQDGGWQIGVSQLGINTWLNGHNGNPTGRNINCDYWDTPPPGMTMEEWLIAREESYTYEVRIYDYTLTTEDRELLDRVLTKGEPARSTHVITDGLDLADMIEGDT